METVIAEKENLCLHASYLLQIQGKDTHNLVWLSTSTTKTRKTAKQTMSSLRLDFVEQKTAPTSPNDIKCLT